MRSQPSGLFRLSVILVSGFLTLQIRSAELVQDRDITIHSTRELEAKRRALIRYLWGTEGFPKRRLPDAVLTNVPSPVKQLEHLARVDELRMELAPGLQGLAYHFVPQHPNLELV